MAIIHMAEMFFTFQGFELESSNLGFTNAGDFVFSVLADASDQILQAHPLDMIEAQTLNFVSSDSMGLLI